MASSFVSLDVETANPRQRSICAVGCVRYEGDRAGAEYYSEINPCEEFSAANTRIHGLCAEQVRDAPTFPAVLDELRAFIGGAPVVAHSRFDEGALRQASEHWRLDPPAWSWFDSIQVARLTWPHFVESGYGLKSLSARLGIPLRHHQALDDAKAAGAIVAAAMREHDAPTFEHLQRKLGLTAHCAAGEAEPRAAQVAPIAQIGPLNGEVVVFSGNFVELKQRVRQRELAARAEELGARVASRVSANTTLFVVACGKRGRQPSKAALTAQRLAADGFLRIIDEYDFRVLCSANQRPLL